MIDDTAITSTAGNTKLPSAPPPQVRPIKLRDAIRWVMRLEGDSDIDGVLDDVRHALSRGDAGCITLSLPSQRYRMSPVQSSIALEEIDPFGGRVRIRTRDLLPRRTDPKYPEALRTFAARYFPAAWGLEVYQIEERLSRFDISRPPHLRDSGGPCLPPFALAAQLGMRFIPEVEEADAAAILHNLDGKRRGFVISRDWIVTETRLSLQRRAQRRAMQSPRVAIEHGGTIGLQHSGSIEQQQQPLVPIKPVNTDDPLAGGTKKRHARTRHLTPTTKKVIKGCLDENSDAGVDNIILPALEKSGLYPDRGIVRTYVSKEKERRAKARQPPA